MGIFSRLRELERKCENLQGEIERVYYAATSTAKDLSITNTELNKLKHPPLHNVGDAIKEGVIFERTFNTHTHQVQYNRWEITHQWIYKCVSKGSSEIKIVTEEIVNPK